MRMKAASSLDGVTALHNGKSQWITSPEARADGHAWRARACTILTGIGTVLEDNPRMNVREVETPRQPRVAVVDSRLDIPLGAHVLQAPSGCLIYTCSTDQFKIKQLQALGATVIHMPNAAGKVDLAAMMRDLAARGTNELHVEAGFKLNGSLIREGLVDEFLLYQAPKLLGTGAMGIANFGPLDDLNKGLALELHEVARVGPDLRIVARVEGRPRSSRARPVSVRQITFAFMGYKPDMQIRPFFTFTSNATRRLQRITALGLAVGAMLLAGCAAQLPKNVERPVSEALSKPQETNLGAMIAQVKPARSKAGASAFVLMNGPQHAYSSRLALVQSAQKTLDLQYYAIHADRSTGKLLHAIVHAARRGVRVRVLLDDFHSTGTDAQVMRLAFVPNVEMRMFNPLAGSRASTLGRAWTILTDFQRAQQRMHNKLFVADNTMGVMGGRNLGDAYFDAANDGNFVDVDVLAAGPVVKDLSRSFDSYWNNVRAYPVQSLISEKSCCSSRPGSIRKMPAPACMPMVTLSQSLKTSLWTCKNCPGSGHRPWFWPIAPPKSPAKTTRPATKQQHLPTRPPTTAAWSP